MTRASGRGLEAQAWLVCGEKVTRVENRVMGSKCRMCAARREAVHAPSSTM